MNNTNPYRQAYSQAGQDLWVIDALNGKRDGTFLEIGAAGPIEYSNTYLLERDYGWTGASLDIKPQECWWSSRKRDLIIADATTFDWHFFYNLESVEINNPLLLDYLSFDVDADQLRAIRNFPWSMIRFRVMSIEHDAYVYGEARRQEIYAILRCRGYVIGYPDVHVGNDGPFEDMWIDPKLVCLPTS